MGKFFSMIYGTVAYAVFFASFLYAIGFVGSLIVPKKINSGIEVPFIEALLINAILLGLFEYEKPGIHESTFFHQIFI